MHMLYRLATLYFCVSRHKHKYICSDMHIHRSLGHRSRCLVKAEEYKQRTLLETIAIYTFSLCAKLSFVKHS